MADLNVALAGLTGGTGSRRCRERQYHRQRLDATDSSRRRHGDRPQFRHSHVNGAAVEQYGVGQDVTSFLNESVAGGAVTAYDSRVRR